MKISTLLSVLIVASSGPAFAGPIVDAATDIENKLNAGDAAGALSAVGDLYNLFVDLQVLDASGNQLANAPEATEYNMPSRHKSHEVPVNITYTLDGLQAGHYTLVTTLRDKNSQKAGSFQTAIEISP